MLFNLSFDHAPASFSDLVEGVTTYLHYTPSSPYASLLNLTGFHPSSLTVPSLPVPVVDVRGVGALLYYPARVALSPLGHIRYLFFNMLLNSACRIHNYIYLMDLQRQYHAARGRSPRSFAIFLLHSHTLVPHESFE